MHVQNKKGSLWRLKKNCDYSWYTGPHRGEQIQYIQEKPPLWTVLDNKMIETSQG